MATSIKAYDEAIIGILRNHGNEDVDLEYIQNKLGMNSQKMEKVAKGFIDRNPEFSEQLGVVPNSEFIIKKACQELNCSITSSNLSLINKKCLEIVNRVLNRRVQNHIDHIFESYKVGEREIHIDRQKLSNILIEEYTKFINRNKSSTVSIAGTLNEAIIRQALIESGLRNHEEFEKTGDRSQGDIVIYHNQDRKNILYGEIKSYHARERLLRALKDISSEKKFGIGFFLKANEFNIKRTRAYADANVLAIYMPDETYEQLSEECRSFMSRLQKPIYRRISEFCKDMRKFVKSGTL